MSGLDKTYYYFIGAGGIGMSALARYFKSLDKVVLGYDKTPTELTDNLIKEGIDLHFEDNAEKIPNYLTPQNTLVIYTPAVPKNHEELQYFINMGFPVEKRSEVLGEITRNSYGIAVAGTHGKTTTSSILAHILHESGLNTSSFLGGILENYETNILLNGNEITVSEADEFDRSFLKLEPKVAIITSMDADHLDIYGEKAELEKTFIEFSQKATDQIFVKKGLPIENAMTYGIESEADFDARNIKILNGNYHFEVYHQNELISDFILKLPGRHNVENATAAIAVAHYLKVSPEKIKSSVESFKGVKRRFNRWDFGDKIYIDDYAHHPTELNALIHSVKEIFPEKKVLGVFQPHLYSRTRDFMEDFAKSLSEFDELILIDIYPAREEPIERITSSALLEKIQMNQKEVSTLSEALDKIRSKDFDVLVTVGAGNIDTLVNPIKQWLDEK